MAAKDHAATARRMATPNKGFTAIRDRFTSLAEVQKALREEGLESSNLVVGVDFTKSNLWNGAKVSDVLSTH